MHYSLQLRFDNNNKSLEIASPARGLHEIGASKKNYCFGDF